MSIKWGKAVQSSSGLWFKPGWGDNKSLQLLVAESEKGVDGSSHDHYWKNRDGSFGVQLKDRSGSSSVADRKGHLYRANTSFSGLVDKQLEDLFDRYC